MENLAPAIILLVMFAAFGLLIYFFVSVKQTQIKEQTRYDSLANQQGDLKQKLETLQSLINERGDRSPEAIAYTTLIEPLKTTLEQALKEITRLKDEIEGMERYLLDTKKAFLIAREYIHQLRIVIATLNGTPPAIPQDLANMDHYVEKGFGWEDEQ